LQAAPWIPRGAARSYGDSALAAAALSTQSLDHFIAFDAANGVLECEAGVTLDTILQCFLPRGWFPAVTPGTRFVTVGGAIASDVHGKNHHLDGCFSAHVLDLTLLLGNGEQITTSPTQHAELFRATCGGMGLTGLIISARLQLKLVTSSRIRQMVIKTPNLEATVEALKAHAGWRYSVAWIDCLAQGTQLGRGVVSFGEHAEEGGLQATASPVYSMPFIPPAALLNRFSVGAFNGIYYHWSGRTRATASEPYEPFFYPLDRIAHWNRLYGAPGFLQYQCLLPFAQGLVGLRRLLEAIAASGEGSFLAVLKLLGPANDNLLSFPAPGYTLALDFKAKSSVFALLNRLDALVLEQGGRVYLTKDARMTAQTFRLGYPRWAEFEEIRARWHAVGCFASDQSRRLGLT
jgi:FAD/FMN-containing dehydrogenase